MTMAVVHLHHLFDVPKALEGVSIGYAMCGRRVPRAQLTKFKDDTTCPACLARVAQKENAPATAASAGAAVELPPTSGKAVIK
jgi:hypothetical protein